MKRIRFLAILYLMTGVLLYSSASNAQISQEDKRIQSAREKAEVEREREKNKIKWEMHKSVTGVFETKFPQEYKYKIFPFQFNNDTIAFSVEITSSLNEKLSKKKEKSILVKSFQTFGSELSYWDVKKILDKEVEKYKYAAKSMGGSLLINEDIKHKGFLGKKFYIVYKTDGKKYGLRILVYLTNYSKVEQVLSGPGHTMYSYRSNDFFDSIILNDGITKKESPIGVGWVGYPSKNNIFTAVLPPKNSDYTPWLPKFSATPRNGRMTFEIKDPVLGKTVKYNIYSYISKKAFSQKKVKQILVSQYISKFVSNVGADSLKINNTVVDGVTTMKTKLIITPTESFPDVTTIFFEAKYKGNILVIQEYLSGNSHANSGLNKILFSLMKFHPEKYKAVKIKKPKESADAKKQKDPQAK